MSDSSQMVVNSLLPGLLLDCASFGILAQRGKAASRLHSAIPLRRTRDQQPLPQMDEHLPVIMAVGAGRIVFVHFGPDGVAADMLSVSDVQAELAALDGLFAVRLRSTAIFRKHLNCEFCWDFVVGGNSGPGQEAIVRRLVAHANIDGDPTRSAVPMVRFIARSIAAHRNDAPSSFSDILPTGYRAFVRTKSVADAIVTLADEDGWFRSFEVLCQVRPPDEDEIFLLFEAGSWILTNRRIYLIDAAHVPAAFSLAEIHSYRIHTLLRQRLEIRLKSGSVVTRPAAEGKYLPAADFDRVLGRLRENGAPVVRVRGQAG